MAGDLGRFLLRGRGTWEEEGEADRWASVVSEGREWAAGLLAQEERRGMHWVEEMGREREREQARGRGLGDSAGWGGEGRKERVGLGFFPFLFPLLFYLKHHSNYLNSNSNLNSTLTLKQKEQCTSMNATTNF